MLGQILEFFAKDMLFKRCSECKNQVLPVQVDECGIGLQYCEKCQKEITDCEYNYNVKMMILDHHTEIVHAVTIYDKVAEDFLGISANDMSKKYQENGIYWKLLESIACGQYIEATFNPKNSLKLDYIKITGVYRPPLVELLNKITAPGFKYRTS